MDINKVTFPLYKLRSYIEIDKNLLGIVKITTIKGTYILDDYSYNGTFEDRRLCMQEEYVNEKIYKLKEQVLYLRQLVKYKSGTTFIDYNGNILKYTKSTKLFKIKSHKIIQKRNHGNWTVINMQNCELPFIIGKILPHTATHASIMETEWGPFLYDITSKSHEIYRRKI